MFWKVLKWVASVLLVVLCGLAYVAADDGVVRQAPGEIQPGAQAAKKFNF